MSARLTSLPFELNKIIFDQLDRKDIDSLRLTCSSLRTTTLHHFRLAFAHRTMDLSPRSLLVLIILCQNEDLGSAIKKLTIVAAYYDPAWLETVSQRSDESRIPEEVDRAATRDSLLELRIRVADIADAAATQSDLRLLTTALQKASNLRTITLESGLYQDPKVRLPVSQFCAAWAEVWKRALHVFTVTMTALAQSRLPLDELHIYGGYWGCGVPTYDIYRLMPDLIIKGLREVLVNVRVLTLSYSTPLSDERFFDTEHFNYEEYPRFPLQNAGSNDMLVSLASDKGSYLGPASFLALCPNLEDLVISLYKPRPQEWCSQEDVSEHYRRYENVFDHIAQSVQMPKLLRCKISGQRIRQHALLQLLRDSPQLKTLELRFVTLVEAGNDCGLRGKGLVVNRVRLTSRAFAPETGIRFSCIKCLVHTSRNKKSDITTTPPSPLSCSWIPSLGTLSGALEHGL